MKDGLLLAGPDTYTCPGNWRAIVPPGPGGIADVLRLPSGALVVGPGSVASHQVTCLALYLCDLWVGTASAGIGVLDFDTETWGVFDTDNSAPPTHRITGGIGGIADDASSTPAWTSHSTAGGLASNDVHGLARAPDDSMWAATAAGLSEWNAGTGKWTAHNATTGALPVDAADDRRRRPGACLGPPDRGLSTVCRGSRRASRRRNTMERVL